MDFWYIFDFWQQYMLPFVFLVSVPLLLYVHFGYKQMYYRQKEFYTKLIKTQDGIIEGLRVKLEILHKYWLQDQNQKEK